VLTACQRLYDGWEQYVGFDGATIGVADFGASALAGREREFSFTPEHVVETANKILGMNR
jgi:transketolase